MSHLLKACIAIQVSALVFLSSLSYGIKILEATQAIVHKVPGSDRRLSRLGWREGTEGHELHCDGSMEGRHVPGCSASR